MRRVALLVFAISVLAAGRSEAETRTNPTQGSMWIATEKPDALDKILCDHGASVLSFPAPLEHAPTLPGALSITGAGREWTVLFEGSRERFEAAAVSRGATPRDWRSPSLNEVFVARANVEGSSA